MPQRADIQHSILVVSGSEKFFPMIRKLLPSGSYMSMEFARSAAAAGRLILERYFDMVIVNAPLSDESGIEFAMSTAEVLSGAGILIVVQAEIYEDTLARVTDYGILALAKPVQPGRIRYGIRFLSSQLGKLKRLEKRAEAAEEKIIELRAVSKAKVLLVEKKHMSEDEAHRLIGKQAMDNGVSRKRIAEQIIDDLE